MGPIAMLHPKLSGPRLLPALAALLLATGCPKHVDAHPEGSGPTAEALLAQVDAAEAKVTRSRGEARLKVSAKEGKTVVTLFVAAEAPARLHLEQLDFFGRPQAVLASDGARFTLFDGQKAKWYRGPATAKTLGRFFPVSLSPPELTALLLGKAPRLAPTAPPTLDTVEGPLHLTLQNAERTDQLWVQAETARVERFRTRGQGDFDLELTEWADHAGARAPNRMHLTRSEAQLELELVWKDLEVNGEADPGLFVLEPPAGTQVVELDARGEPVVHSDIGLAP